MSTASSGDMYVPVGIKEIAREGSAPRELPARPTEQSSQGVQELEAVRNGAKYTLRGLLAFQWASLFMSLSEYAGLATIALVGAALWTAGAVQAGSGAIELGLFGLAAWAVGIVTLLLFALAVINALLGIRASHKGRTELGALQRREVEAAERSFWRGVIWLTGGAFVTVLLSFQEGTFSRFATIPYATPVALAIGAVTGGIAASYFGGFLGRYLRNLAPGKTKKSRRRFRLVFAIAWALPIAVTLGGVAATVHASEFACLFNDAGCGVEQLTLSAPALGPPFYLVRELVYDQYLGFMTALILVVGGLVASRLIGVFALGSYRGQLRAAEIILRSRIRANKPTEAPPG